MLVLISLFYHIIGDLIVAGATVLAVCVAYYFNRKHETRKYRKQLLAILMCKDMHHHIDSGFAENFNTIKLEFSDSESVLKAWQELYDSLLQTFPNSGQHREEKKKNLGYHIAKTIKLKNPTALMSGVYVPQGYVENQTALDRVVKFAGDAVWDFRAYLTADNSTGYEKLKTKIKNWIELP